MHATPRLANVLTFASEEEDVQSVKDRTSTEPKGPPPRVVLLHDHQSDAASWAEVIELLRREETVVDTAAQSHSSPADDAAGARLAIELRPGPVVLVGHSRAAAILSDLADHPKVAALVFVAGLDHAGGERRKPCWYAVSSDDRVIPAASQRLLARRMNAVTMELECGSLPMVTHPRAIADLILAACRTTWTTDDYSEPS